MTAGIMLSGFVAILLLWPEPDVSRLPPEERCADAEYRRERHRSIEECVREQTAQDLLKGGAAGAGQAAVPQLP